MASSATVKGWPKKAVGSTSAFFFRVAAWRLAGERVEPVRAAAVEAPELTGADLAGTRLTDVSNPECAIPGSGKPVGSADAGAALLGPPTQRLVYSACLVPTANQPRPAFRFSR